MTIDIVFITHLDLENLNISKVANKNLSPQLEIACQN
jgi:hypothetical protein